MGSKAYDVAFKLNAKLSKTYSSAFSKAEEIARRTASSITRTITAVGAIVLSVSAVKGAVDKAVSFESAMADVAKTVDGLKDQTGNVTDAYAAMSKELLDMTAYLPMTGEELAKITAAAGQAGIAAEDLTKFTETAAKMGVAFDITADQAGDWMATWRTAFKMSQSEVTTLADQINYLSNTSSENAIKLSGVVTRIGSLGEISGVSAAEIAAMAASMTGVTEEISATGIKNLMKAMNSGNAATKSQAAVLDKLGFSATKMAERMQKDAKGAILDLLAAFKKLPEAEQSAAITQYFGSESVAAIAPLISNLENLEEQFYKIGDASLYAGSMEDEFNSRAATTENKMQLAKNAIERLQISMGNLLLPIVSKVAIVFADMVNSVTDKLPAILEKFKPLADFINNSILPLIPQIQEKLTTLLDSVLNNLAPKFNEFKNMAIETFNWISNTASTAFNNVKQVIESNYPIFQNLIAVLLNVKDKLLTAFEIARPAIEWLFIEGLPRVTGIFLEIVDGATNIYNSLDKLSLIEPIIAGIVTGFVTFKSALAIVTTINGITNSIKALTTAMAIQGATMKASAATQALATIGMKAYAVASGLLKGQLTLQAAATGMATAFQTAFNIVMAANPIGMTVLAISALVAAIVAATIIIVKNWDKIKAFFIELWSKLTEIFGNIGNWFKEKFTVAKEAVVTVIQGIIDWIEVNWKSILLFIINPFAGVFNYLYNNFEGFRNFVDGVIESVKNFFIGLGDKIKGIFGSIANWFNVNVITPLKNFFIPIINFIVGLFSIIWEKVADIWKQVASWFQANVIQPVIMFFSFLKDSIVTFFQNAWDGIMSAWSVVASWFNDNVIQPVIAFFIGLKDSIVNAFQNAWAGAVSVWGIVSSWFNDNVIQPVISFFSGLKDSIIEFFQNAWNSTISIWVAISSWFDTNVIQPIINLFSSLVESISQVGGEISNTLISIFTGPIDFIKEKWQGLKGFFAGLLGDADKITAKGEAITGLKTVSIPGFATGSNYTPSTFIAGERGAELITNAKGSKVFTAAETGNIFNNMSRIPEVIAGGISSGIAAAMNTVSNLAEYDNLNLVNGSTENENTNNIDNSRTVQTSSSYSQAPTFVFSPQNTIYIYGDESNTQKQMDEHSSSQQQAFLQMMDEWWYKKCSREMRTSNA